MQRQMYVSAHILGWLDLRIINTWHLIQKQRHILEHKHILSWKSSIRVWLTLLLVQYTEKYYIQ